MNVVIDTIMTLVRFGMELSGKRRDYMKWRLSDEGKQHFSRKEENRFWEALANGDDSVISVGIQEKQKRIDKLKRELGLTVVLFCLLLPGCRHFSNPAGIPDGIPDMNVNSLQESERTYVVSNMELNVPEEGRKTLTGPWHVVSSDFIVKHTRNQDDLIEALVLLKKERGRRAWYIGITAFSSIVLTILIGAAIARISPRPTHP
jgi:hypothetical protein